MPTIILADDDKMVRTLLCRGLENAGMTVRRFADGTFIDDPATFDGADLLITDILMPDTDGLEVVRRVRAESPDLPIIAISGGGQVDGADYLKYAKKLGCNSALKKPIKVPDLITAIEELLPEENEKDV